MQSDSKNEKLNADHGDVENGTSVWRAVKKEKNPYVIGIGDHIPCVQDAPSCDESVASSKGDFFRRAASGMVSKNNAKWEHAFSKLPSTSLSIMKGAMTGESPKADSRIVMLTESEPSAEEIIRVLDMEGQGVEQVYAPETGEQQDGSSKEVPKFSTFAPVLMKPGNELPKEAKPPSKELRKTPVILKPGFDLKEEAQSAGRGSSKNAPVTAKPENDPEEDTQPPVLAAKAKPSEVPSPDSDSPYTDTGDQNKSSASVTCPSDEDLVSTGSADGTRDSTSASLVEKASPEDTDTTPPNDLSTMEGTIEEEDDAAPKSRRLCRWALYILLAKATIALALCLWFFYGRTDNTEDTVGALVSESVSQETLLPSAAPATVAPTIAQSLSPTLNVLASIQELTSTDPPTFAPSESPSAVEEVSPTGTPTLATDNPTTQNPTTQNPTTQSPTFFPTTQNPTFVPTHSLDFLEEDYSVLLSTDRIPPPQTSAQNWLFGHPEFASMPNWRKEQLFALATFFFAMEGPKWPETIRNNWLQYSDECQWFYSDFYPLDDKETFAYDVTPCTEDGQYQAILLADLRLSGYEPFAPSELGLLTTLRVLELPANGIDIPLEEFLPLDTLAQMDQLEVLNLHGNSLAGPLTANINLLSSLKKLDVHKNELTGAIPTELALLTQMVDLDLHANTWSGSIPSELGLMATLNHLSLYNGSLKGTIPVQLGALTQLTAMSLRDNQLEGPIPSELGLLLNLKSLALHNNVLTSTIPTQLDSLPIQGSLQTMLVVNNNLEGTISNNICSLGLLSSSTGSGLYFDCDHKLCGCLWCECKSGKKMKSGKGKDKDKGKEYTR